ncbi:MAG TPA: alternative ribosome rescue aminoacyl-tRNA hydrolase ArfB [Gaiellales bacterium]|nr:alternative ribosome rescue aminoacyl-tRNA hydrolase ArfB [Gaiellales bacterium]
MLDIGAARELSEDELEFRYSRSGGPGGQHVNTSSTRVELVFDLEGSAALSERELELARRRLRSRLDSSGRLRVVVQDERSRARNRAIAVERFCDLMRAALAPPPPPRRPTRPGRAAVEERIQQKRRAGERKRLRRPPGEEGE